MTLASYSTTRLTLSPASRLGPEVERMTLFSWRLYVTRRNSSLSLEPSCFLVTTPVRFLMSMVKMLRGMSSTGPCVTSSSICNQDLRRS